MKLTKTAVTQPSCIKNVQVQTSLRKRAGIRLYDETGSQKRPRFVLQTVPTTVVTAKRIWT